MKLDSSLNRMGLHYKDTETEQHHSALGVCIGSTFYVDGQTAHTELKKHCLAAYVGNEVC